MKFTGPEDTDAITPVEDLFVYHIFGYPRALKSWLANPASYSFEVKGLVSSPQSFSLSQIRERFKPASATVILQCMTNVHRGRVEVGGPRLLDVLEEAGMSAGATKIAIRGGEGFETDLFIDEVRREPEKFILAYEMNGKPLTAEHGFPLRVVADGKYAYKWCKWVTSLELVNYDFKGHYEGKRQWSDAATRGEPVI